VGLRDVAWVNQGGKHGWKPHRYWRSGLSKAALIRRHPASPGVTLVWPIQRKDCGGCATNTYSRVFVRHPGSSAIRRLRSSPLFDAQSRICRGIEPRLGCDQDAGGAFHARATRPREISLLSPCIFSRNTAFITSCPPLPAITAKVSRRGPGGLDLDQGFEPGSLLNATSATPRGRAAYSGPDPFANARTPIQASIASPTNGNSTT